MPFFGYRFAPRLRDINERRLHLLPRQEAGQLLAGMVGDPIACDHAAAYWDELLRLATSIRTGTVNASSHSLRQNCTTVRADSAPRRRRPCSFLTSSSKGAGPCKTDREDIYIRAYVIERYKAPLTVRDMPDSQPGLGQVLVAIAATSVDQIDGKLRDGDFKAQLPMRCR